MQTLPKCRWLVAFLLVIWLIVPTASSAEFQPHVVISSASYSELKSDLRYLGALFGNPQLAEGLEAVLLLQTQGRLLMALDRTQRFGVALQFDPSVKLIPGEMPEPAAWVVVIPITNANAFLKLVQVFAGIPLELEKGLYQASTPDGFTVFFKVEGGWALLSPQRDVLTALPRDLAGLIAGAGTRYDVALQLNFSKLPLDWQDSLVEALKSQLLGTLVQSSQETDAAFQMRSALVDQILSFVEDAYTEIDEVTWGFTIDREKRVATFDVAVTAVQGGTAERVISQAKALPSHWGDLPGTNPAVYTNFSGRPGWALAENLLRGLDRVRLQALEELERSEWAKAFPAAQTLVNSVLDTLREVATEPEWDWASAVWTGPERRAAVFAIRSKGLSGVNRLLQNIAGAIEDSKELKAVVEPEVAAVGNVVIHRVRAKIGAHFNNRQQLVDWLGQEELEFAAAVGPDRVLLAAGANTVELLRELAREGKTPSEAQPRMFRMFVDVAAFGRLAELSGELGNQQDGEQARLVREVLKQVGEPVRMGFTMTPLPRGLEFQIELNEGFLKAAAEVVRRQTGGVLPMPLPGQAPPTPSFRDQPRGRIQTIPVLPPNVLP